MAMPFVSALPLRVPLPQSHLGGMLASWMDHAPSMGLSSEACAGDLDALGRLRKELSMRTQEGLDAAEAEDLAAKLHEYYHLLLECESHGMAQETDGNQSSPPPSDFVSLDWKSCVMELCRSEDPTVRIQSARSLEEERVNLLWNLAALEAHRASLENRTTKPGWRKASNRLQTAASWLSQLLAMVQQNPSLGGYPDTCAEFLAIWRALLLAQAQHCIYESVRCAKRLLALPAAKLAAGAVPLYATVETVAQQGSASNPSLSQLPVVADWILFARAWGAYMSCQAEHHQSQIHRDKKDWGSELARLNVAYLHAAVCQTHCGERPGDPGTESLRAAVEATLQDLLARNDEAERDNAAIHHRAVPSPEELTEIRGETLVKAEEPLDKLLRPKTTEPLFRQRKAAAAAAFVPSPLSQKPKAKVSSGGGGLSSPTGHNNYNHMVKQPSQLPPTSPDAAPPPPLVAVPSINSMEKKKAAVPTLPVFSSGGGGGSYNTNTTKTSSGNGRRKSATSDKLPSTNTAVAASRGSNAHSSSSATNNQLLQTYAEIFRTEMTELVHDLARATEDQTESARLALADVHLPHSLTAYKQEQSGGGLPDELWERVALLQSENRVITLKQNLWELKDSAEMARATHETIQKQLEFDVESDRNFRAANPGFEGHDAASVQQSFWKPLANYDEYLNSAQEGDAVLFQRLEQLDIEPKYNLLQFSKSQLDRLLPGARGKSDGAPAIDTRHLSQLLGELSALFHERDHLVDTMRKDVQSFDIVGVLQEKVSSDNNNNHTKGTDREYLEATNHAQTAFDGIRQEIRDNMDTQDELLGTILEENEAFMAARGTRTATAQSADSCIVMIEDAIEEIDQLSKHLKEGKDFYSVVIPKLNELKQQVDDASARLTVERLEYSEKEFLASQERKDALMAKKLFTNENKTPMGTNASHNSMPSGSNSNVAVPAAASAASASSFQQSQEPPSPGVVSSPFAAASAAAANRPVSPARRQPPASLMSRSARNELGARHLAHGNSGMANVPPVVAVAASAASRVDDEKVATLVAMEFDADRVVAALEKHNNDMDGALNELLSC